LTARGATAREAVSASSPCDPKTASRSAARDDGVRAASLSYARPALWGEATTSAPASRRMPP
jgi:hypothetical protein